MSVRQALLALVVLSLQPLALSGQSRSRSVLPEAGSHGISFSLPSGGGASFGIRKMLSASTNGGIDLSLGVNHAKTETGGVSNSATTTSVSVRPGARLYHASAGPVAPFLHLYGLVSYVNGPNDMWTLGGGAGVGVGAEWFPLEHMSISGYTGLDAMVEHEHDTGGTTADQTVLRAATSGLSLNLYF